MKVTEIKLELTEELLEDIVGMLNEYTLSMGLINLTEAEKDAWAFMRNAYREVQRVKERAELK